MKSVYGKAFLLTVHFKPAKRPSPLNSKNVRVWCENRQITQLDYGRVARAGRSVHREAGHSLRRPNPPPEGERKKKKRKKPLSPQHMASSSGSGGGVEGGVGEGPTTLDELYQINVVPAELHFKFRKELQGIRVGLNLEVSSRPIYYT